MTLTPEQLQEIARRDDKEINYGNSDHCFHAMEDRRLLLAHVSSLETTIRELTKEQRACRSCGTQFHQDFVCITCGAQKLYDVTVLSLEKQLSLTREGLDWAMKFQGYPMWDSGPPHLSEVLDASRRRVSEGQS